MDKKEMTPVIHYMQVLRNYFLGNPFVVKINNVAMSYFITQTNLSSKQAWWKDFLDEFDLTI